MFINFINLGYLGCLGCFETYPNFVDNFGPNYTTDFEVAS